MKIAIIGASGNAGSRITKELAGRGHAITAIARNPAKIAVLPNVVTRAGDVMDQAGLAAILKGHDAAISSVHFLDSDPAKLIGAAPTKSFPAHFLIPRAHDKLGGLFFF
jgi:putative NADH-flavin reductase